MAPTVLICNSISELIQRAGSGQHIVLSSAEPTDGIASKILKLAAPLCKANWKIYVERLGDGSTCNFGVFCGSLDPTSLSVTEVLFSDSDPAFPIVCVAQTVTNKVGVFTSGGDGIEFRFNDDVDSDITNTNDLVRLGYAVSSADMVGREAFAGLTTRVIGDAVRSSHGTLIAVVNGASEEVPEFLADATVLNPPLDLYAKFREHVDAAASSVSLGNIAAACELLAGFIHSDGITVFSSSGKVLAYRAFVKSEADQNPAMGGARTRAFQSLKAQVGETLGAAFFRSQDGRMEMAFPEQEQMS